MNLSDKSGVSIQSAALMRSEFFGQAPGSVGVQRNETIGNAYKCRLGQRTTPLWRRNAASRLRQALEEGAEVASMSDAIALKHGARTPSYRRSS